MSIDDLLSQPLPTVADNGFSARVLTKVRAENRRRVMLIAGASAAAAAAVAAFLPIPAASLQLNDELTSLMTVVINSPAVPIALCVAGLTFFVDRNLFHA